MAIVMNMHWPEATQDQYDKLRERVGWEASKPTGGIFHVAWWEDDGMHILDVWESREDFERCMAERAMPGIEAIGGIPGRPDVSIAEVYGTNVGAIEALA